MAKQYKRHSRGGRFRQQGDGLRAAVDRIRQQRQIEIDALKTQNVQQSEVNRLQISGMSNVARNEAINRDILRNLDDKIHTNKRNAIALKGQREVEKLIGEAKLAGQEARFWEDFTKRGAKNYTDLATGLTDFAMYRSAVNAYEKMSEDDRNNFANSQHAAYEVVGKDVNGAIYQIKDLKDRKDLVNKTHGWFANNHHLHAMLADDYVKSIKDRVNFVRVSSRTEDGANLYNKNNAGQLLLNSAYLYMYQNGIPFASKAGQTILQITKRQITAETLAYTNSEQLATDQKNLFGQIDTVKVLYTNRNNSAEDLQAWKDGLLKLKTVVAGSALKGDNNSISLASDTNRAALYTDFDYWKITIDYLIDNLDFKTEAEALDALNIFTSQDGQPPILDRHEDIQRYVKEKVAEKLTTLADNKKDLNESKFIQDLNTQFLDPFRKDLLSGDFTNTTLNKEWRQAAFDFITANPQYKDHELVKNLYEAILYDPKDYGDSLGLKNSNFTFINNANEAFLTAQPEVALFWLSQVTTELPSHMRSFHPALKAMLEVPKFNEKLNNFITNSFKDYLPYTYSPTNELVLETEFDYLEPIARARFMEIWMNKSDVKNADDRFIQSKLQLTEEIRLGVQKQEGLFAADRNKDATKQGTYIFRILNQYGLPIEGQTVDITSEINGSNNSDGWYGASVNSEVDTPSVSSLFDIPKDSPISFDWSQNIDTNLTGIEMPEISDESNPFDYLPEIELPPLESFAFEDTKDPTIQRNNRVRGLVDTNLGRLISETNAVSLLNRIQLGKVTFNDIPPNLTEFIAETKKHYPKMTTKEIMDIVLDSIYRNGDVVWKTPDDKDMKRGINDQFEGVVWPMDMATFTKQICGTTTNSEKNNHTLCILTGIERSGVDPISFFTDRILKGAQ